MVRRICVPFTPGQTPVRPYPPFSPLSPRGWTSRGNLLRSGTGPRGLWGRWSLGFAAGVEIGEGTATRRTLLFVLGGGVRMTPSVTSESYKRCSERHLFRRSRHSNSGRGPVSLDEGFGSRRERNRVRLQRTAPDPDRAPPHPGRSRHPTHVPVSGVTRRGTTVVVRPRTGTPSEAVSTGLRRPVRTGTGPCRPGTATTSDANPAGTPTAGHLRTPLSPTRPPVVGSLTRPRPPSPTAPVEPVYVHLHTPVVHQ